MEHEHHEIKARLSNALLGLQPGSHADAGMCLLIDTLSSAIDDALIITDQQFAILHTNDSVYQHLGYRAPELNGKQLSELFSEDHWPPFEAVCLAYTSQPSSSSSPFSGTVSLTTKDDLDWFAAVSLQYLHVGDENVFIFLFSDSKHRTATRQIMQQKRQQQLRLQAIGRLTAGLAHEYNNLLTSIVGYSDILRMHLDENDVLSRYIDQISRASIRAADLTRHVMAFSRHTSNQPEIFDLNAIISDMEKMIRGLFEEDVELVFQFTPHPSMIRMDFGALLQILIIVLLSVRDELSRDSLVTLTTNKHRPLDRSSSSSDDPTSEFINLAIGYTIKDAPVDIGRHDDSTPLELRSLQEDLEVVFNLVRQVGGEINVVRESATKKTYNIYFPDAHQALESLVTEDLLQVSSPGRETILVVDDEDMVRALICEALQIEGYRVLEASRPIEALNISRQYENTIHLLVSDVVMPGMNGRELAEQLVAERPHLRLLFISGHSPHILKRCGVDSVKGRFLQKPFSTSTLLANVRSALTPPSPHSLSSKSFGQA